MMIKTATTPKNDTDSLWKRQLRRSRNGDKGVSVSPYGGQPSLKMFENQTKLIMPGVVAVTFKLFSSLTKHVRGLTAIAGN